MAPILSLYKPCRPNLLSKNLVPPMSPIPPTTQPPPITQKSQHANPSHEDMGMNHMPISAAKLPLIMWWTYNQDVLCLCTCLMSLCAEKECRKNRTGVTFNKIGDLWLCTSRQDYCRSVLFQLHRFIGSQCFDSPCADYRMLVMQTKKRKEDNIIMGIRSRNKR